MENDQRKIIHIDMDCFYAAIEMRDRPDLREKPMAVGGRPDLRGVITTCNYEARKFGVHSALSSREALRRCPQLVILPTRFQKYKDVSRQIHLILKKYSDNIEPLSLDEAYLDVSNSAHFDGSATLTAQAIRKDIEEQLQITASAGVANSKFLAKVASDWNKPNGQLTIKPDQVRAFVSQLPVSKIPGVGRATLKKMHALEIQTCLDLQQLPLDDLVHRFGKFGERLFDLCRGVDRSSVKSDRTRKSISVETTFSNDLADWQEIHTNVEKLFDELSLRMRKTNILAEHIKSLAIKFKSKDFIITSKERAVPFSKENFLKLAEDHFFENSEPLRLLGIGCKLDVKERKKMRHQLNLF